MNSLCEKCNNKVLGPGDNTDSLAYFQQRSGYEDKLVKDVKKTFKMTQRSLFRVQSKN